MAIGLSGVQFGLLIIRVIAAGVLFVYHEYHYRQNPPHEVPLPINHKNYSFPEKKKNQVRKERETLH